MKSLLFLCLVCLSGCEDKTRSTANPLEKHAASNDSITADELLRSLEGHTFIVTLPEDHQSSHHVGLAIRHFDGTVICNSSSSIGNAGERVRVVIFKPNKQGMKYTLLTDSSFMSATLTSELIGQYVMYGSSTKKRNEIGDVLMRYTTSGELNIEHDQKEGDLDIILYRKPIQENKSAHTNPLPAE